jgi:ABC-2 type transport system ATP-binding protein
VLPVAALPASAATMRGSEAPPDCNAARVIDVDHVTKRYGDRVAVDDLTIQVKPGIVTGFLGPNGAGKSTTMRVILGLDTPTSGRSTVNGKAYRDLPAPLHEIGAMLEARAVHTGRSAYNHLLAMAQTHGISRRRVVEVIDLVGLSQVAEQRVGSFSLGMGQRLGIAAALLGDPSTVILDEPANGLDPEGILWIRTLLKRLAADGKTVFLSSHLMSEMAQTAEHLIVVGRGRLIADTTVAEIVTQASRDAMVFAHTARDSDLATALSRAGASVTPRAPHGLEVRGLSSPQIGAIAQQAQIIVHELTPQRASLEQAFMSLTGSSVEYQAGVPAGEISEVAA